MYLIIDEGECKTEHIKTTTTTTSKQSNKGIAVYKKLCRKYGRTPIKNIWRQFGNEIVSLKGYNISAKEMKAFFVAILVRNMIRFLWQINCRSINYTCIKVHLLFQFAIFMYKNV